MRPAQNRAREALAALVGLVFAGAAAAQPTFPTDELSPPAPLSWDLVYPAALQPPPQAPVPPPVTAPPGTAPAPQPPATQPIARPTQPDPFRRLFVPQPYIENPVPVDMFRLRYDFGAGFNAPERAEFFYAQRPPGGPGLPLPETKLSHQDVSAYLETRVAERWSLFVELPVRFLNPEVNANATGLGDMNVGAKRVLWASDTFIASGQLRAYIPSGNANRGLGNAHATLEPGLLTGWVPNDRLSFGAELRYWVPLGGTSFAGDVLRYGVGFRYNYYQNQDVRLSYLVDFVGWEVLSGQQVGRSATGTSIFNAKIGYRFDWRDRYTVYMGYARALTGPIWYRDGLRADVSFFY